MPGFTAGRRPRHLQAAAVGLAVLALHGLTLVGLAGLGGGTDERVRPTTATVQVRSLAPDPPGVVSAAQAPPPSVSPPPPQPRGEPVVATAVEAAPPAETPLVPAAVRLPASVPPALNAPTEPAAAVEAVAAVAAMAADAPDASRAQPAVPPPTVAEPATAAASAALAAEPAGTAPPDAGGQTLPVYAAQLPPAATLDYVLRRGLLSGSGRLVWAPAADGGYEARLEGGAFGQTLLAQVSTGRVGEHGLAPDRFTDRRRGRGEQAANFQRAAGRISFSGPTVSYPLHPGAQDRVSWLVQLGAILAADPALQRPGAEIRLFVVGARGDADVWTFIVQGPQTLSLPGRARTDTLHVLRAPHRPFDTRAEAWLDPARGLLPVRVRLATPDSGDETELVLARD